MLKLGLCGWFDPSADPSASRSLGQLGISSSPSHEPGPARLDTLELVEKVISVVRKRRSVKAIETYEQVQFLVDFVDFLRDNSSR